MSHPREELIQLLSDAAGGLTLVPYAAFHDPHVLGKRHADLYRGNQERVSAVLPVNDTRYASYQTATKFVVDTIAAVAANADTQAAYAVVYDGVVVGDAWLWVRGVTGRGRDSGGYLVRGPQMSFWLGARSNRPQSAAVKPLMPLLLPVLRQQALALGMSGVPWVLAPKNDHCATCLQDGGFFAPRPLSDYVRADGVWALRVLYIPIGATLE